MKGILHFKSFNVKKFYDILTNLEFWFILKNVVQNEFCNEQFEREQSFAIFLRIFCKTIMSKWTEIHTKFEDFFMAFSGFWLFILTLFVKVPATMMTSACLGEALKTTPYLSMSYLGAAMCIISTAQHAKPKVKGHKEFLRPQFAKSSIRAIA